VTRTLVGPAAMREGVADGAQAVAQMGYQAVELAHSYYGHDAPPGASCWTKNGLKSCGMHMGLGALQGDAFDKDRRDSQTARHALPDIASLPHEKLASVPAIAERARVQRVGPSGSSRTGCDGLSLPRW